jgi:hypothetical protein
MVSVANFRLWTHPIEHERVATRDSRNEERPGVFGRRQPPRAPYLVEIQSAGSHDEPLWSSPHKVKRVTGNQRKGLPRSRLQNPGLVRIDDVSECDAVAVLGARDDYPDNIARLEFAEAAKECIAMGS